MKPKEIAEILTKIEEEKGIAFNEMSKTEFMKWVRFIGKDTS